MLRDASKRYLYYDNGVVKYDGLPVQGRFKKT